MIRFINFCGTFLAIVFLLSSCASVTHDKKEIEASIAYYDHLIEKVDADSISLMYTQDGNLGNIAIGRDSIRKFLNSFKNVRVILQKSTTAAIELIKDTAIQKGSYIQKDILSEKDTIVVKGEFEARWEWIEKEGWRIKQMTTKPAT